MNTQTWIRPDGAVIIQITTDVSDDTDSVREAIGAQFDYAKRMITMAREVDRKELEDRALLEHCFELRCAT